MEEHVMEIAEVMRMMMIRIIRLKTIITPRGRTCSTGGGSVREEGRAAPLTARAQTRAALRCFHSELIKGSREQDVDEPDTRKKSLPFNLCVPLFGVLVFPRGAMSVCRAVLVLLCAVLAVTSARRSSPEQDDVQEKINSARCTSRCLTLHMTQLTAAFRHLQVPTATLSLI